jgi:hypothetical protein
MGTNVYALKKNPRKLANWDKLRVIIDNEDPWSLIDSLEEIRAASEKNMVHIGKRSAGWKFYFDFNSWKYYDHTEESIKKFLESCFDIQDEYGDSMTVDEFWKDFALADPDGWDMKTYHEKEMKKSSDGYYQQYVTDHQMFMSTHSPAGPIPSDLPYYFSNDSDFS